MNPSRPDVVFDCNVFLQAISRIQGPAAQALRLVESNALTLYVSRPILRELRRALAYPEVRQKNPAITDDVVGSFLARISFRGVMIRNVPHVVDLPRDPKDEPYLDLAVAVSADYLVTRDQDLLSLGSDYSIESKKLRQRVPNLKVMNTNDFLQAFSTQS
jgi:putative PIN family toxin of toxin-antitoxin system